MNGKSGNSRDAGLQVMVFFVVVVVVVVVLIPNFSCCCVFFPKELVKVHRNLVQEIHDSIVNKNDQNLYQVFINYKER